MSDLERFENIKQIVGRIEPEFTQLAKLHNAVNFKREASFALDILKNNAYMASVAMGDQDSFKRAIINVAAIGLSLSPVSKLAYLVPRMKKICLDISCRGYIQLAVDIGSVKWVKAELVKESDFFEYQGMGKEPVHKFNPFKDRGLVLGAYCVAKTHDEEFIIEMMPIDEIYSIRDRSEAWKAYLRDNAKKNPWVTDESEMIKKTVIKRAYKSWPMTNTRQRLEKAIDVSNETDVIELNQTIKTIDSGALNKARSLLKQLNRTEDEFMNHAMRVFKRNVKTLDDLTSQEINQANSMLETFVEKKSTQIANTIKTEDSKDELKVEKEKTVLKNYAPGSDLDVGAE